MASSSQNALKISWVSPKVLSIGHLGNINALDAQVCISAKEYLHRIQTASTAKNSLTALIQDEKNCAFLTYNSILFLSDLLMDSHLSITDKNNIRVHLKLLKEFKKTYNAHNLDSIIDSNELSIGQFSDHYQSDVYCAYERCIEELIPSANKMTTMVNQYDHLKERAQDFVLSSQAISTREKNQYQTWRALSELYPVEVLHATDTALH